MRRMWMVAVVVVGGVVASGSAGGRVFSCVPISGGNLDGCVADNTAGKNGVQMLHDHVNAPGFEILDPAAQAAAGDAEHIISGTELPLIKCPNTAFQISNQFTPRCGPFPFTALAPNAARLTRDYHNEPWQIGTTIDYTFLAPDRILIDWHATFHNASLFAPWNYAVFFTQPGGYMNEVGGLQNVYLHGWGVPDLGQPEGPITMTGDQPPYKSPWNGGGAYRAPGAPQLAYATNYSTAYNLWSYNGPYPTEPWYYGRTQHGLMVEVVAKMLTPNLEFRPTIFRFGAAKFCTVNSLTGCKPAWDAQVVVHVPQNGVDYHWQYLIIVKPFASADDARQEALTWLSTQ